MLFTEGIQLEIGPRKSKPRILCKGIGIKATIRTKPKNFASTQQYIQNRERK